MRSRKLTDFQETILKDIFLGESFKVMAKRYECSISLVNFQVKNICKKLGVNYWGMKGARRKQTQDALKKVIDNQNDSNRSNL